MHNEEQIDQLRQASQEKPLTRRDFMRVMTVASAAGPGLMAAGLGGFSLTGSQRAEAAELVSAGLGKLPKVQYGTKMGKMMVTPVCIAQDWGGDLFAPALELGINFIHKAGYWGNNVPEEIKKLPRESYYTDITVDNTSPGHNPDNMDEAYGQVTSSLEKNGLKYYDVYRAHYGWESLASFNKGFNTSYKAFERLKREGKVKFFGVSQHPYIPYPEIIQAQIDSGVIASMQVWFGYGDAKENMDIFAKASKAGIAMTAMKVFAHGSRKMRTDVARQEALKAPGLVGRALIRDVMTAKREDGKPVFHTCVTNVRSLDKFEENVGGVSPKVSLRDGFVMPYA